MLKKSISQKLNISIFQRIEFWIILFFMIRLIGITNPPLELNHNWRQVTGLMVSRNFLEVDNNLFYPRVDDNQGREGIIGMEFPLMNYIYYMISKIFGYTHWYGRLLNLIVSSIGIFYFYRILKEKFDHKTGLYSSILLLSSIWLTFSRKMMPDTFCISLMFIALYYGFNYFEHGKWKNYFLFVLFTGTALLTKIPAGIYLTFYVFYFYSKEYKTIRKILVLFSLIMVLLGVYQWYFIWNPHLSQTFGVWYNSGESFREGVLSITHNINSVWRNFYFSSFYSYSSFCIFLFGLYYMFKTRNISIILIFFSIFSVFVIYIFKSGIHFIQNYYIIPFVPIMALTAGYGLTQINMKKIVVVVLFVCTVEGIANQQHDFFIKSSEKTLLKLEPIADSFSNRTDLIVINENSGNPQRLYFTHRKGWLCSNSMLTDTGFVNKIQQKGCKYMFVCKKDTSVIIPYNKIYSDDDFDVFDISPGSIEVNSI